MMTAPSLAHNSGAFMMGELQPPMQVYLDISKLGEGHKQAQRAGIFRYTYELAMGLMHAKTCQLSLCAGASFERLSWAHQFLKTEPTLSACPFVVHPHLENVLDRVDHDIATVETWSAFLHKRGIKRTKKLKEIFLRLKSPREGLIGSHNFAKTDIYHSTYYCIPEAFKHPTVKTFVTIHDLIPFIYPDLFIKSIREQFTQVINGLSQKAWILCVSESTKRDLLNYRPDLDVQKVFVTPLAASDKFHPHANDAQIQAVKRKYGIATGRPYLLSLSTLEIRKNIPHLIRAFIALISQESSADLCLVLAGQKGWLAHDIYRELEHLSPQLKSRIIFTGYVEDEDLAALYKGAIAFVYPSLYEGFGLPPLEAMQCGTPVITSNTSSLPEVVGDAGLMVNPLDQDGLAQAMFNIYTDHSLRTHLAAQSLEQAAKFSWEICTQQTLAAYKYALNA